MNSPFSAGYFLLNCGVVASFSSIKDKGQVAKRTKKYSFAVLYSSFSGWRDLALEWYQFSSPPIEPKSSFRSYRFTRTQRKRNLVPRRSAGACTEGHIMETKHTETVVDEAVTYVKDMLGLPPGDKSPYLEARDEKTQSDRAKNSIRKSLDDLNEHSLDIRAKPTVVTKQPLSPAEKHADGPCR